MMLINNKAAFTEWISKQGQKSNPSKLYSEESKKAFIRCIEKGLIRAANLDDSSANLFLIDDVNVVEEIAKEHYTQIIAYDKKNQNSDLKLGIEFYIKFLKEKFAIKSKNVSEQIIFKIKKVIAEYKKNFTKIHQEEIYKWIAVKEYKRYWSHFYSKRLSDNIKQSYGKAHNLLQASYYYPLNMLCEYAEKDPETVWYLFNDLYREENDFVLRYTKFKTEMDSYFKKQNLSSYQDLHAISVYLSFEYPEKYFIYKYSIFNGMNKLINFTEEKIDSMTDIEKYGLYCDICNLIISEINEDSELQKMHFARLTKECYRDEKFHLLAMDIAYFGSKLTTLGDDYEGFWPSLEEYNPNLTKDQWKEFLETDRVSFPSTLAMLKVMLELEGESTCKKLGELLQVKASSCVLWGTNLGKRVKKAFNLPPCMDDDVERFFAIPFLWKATVENNQDLAIWRLRPQLKAALEEMDLSDMNTIKEKTDVGQNTILYGPPGTGKTYNTVCYAVAIVENKPIEKVMVEASSENGYAEVFERYNEYKNQGLIAFSTFHQSYGYEEFIEGIKPVMDADDDDQSDIKYSVTDGVFKEFCENATSVISVDEKEDIGLNNSPSVWKVSLWATGDNPVRTECLENGHIRIGWDYYGPDITSETDFSACGGRNVLNSFLYKMKIGDIVLSCYSSTTVDAVGIVIGDYEWSGDYEELNRVRKVNWLVKGINEDIFEMNNNTVFTLSTVYKTQISVADALSIVEKHSDVFNERVIEQKNRVFIIDEINRGNISKIFGELITLIEPSKRIGAKEGIKAILPYSKSAFGVPNNVYILGTMNTADRSIATLDTALRRRFDFVEMMPDADVLADVDVDGINISRMLKKINERIEVLFDREHTIGHAYFIGLKDNNSVDALADIFRNKVIPLLQEYFYEDYERIRLVLADNQVSDAEKEKQFIVAKDVKINELFGTNDVDILEDSKHYHINTDAFENKDAYIKIYSK